MLTIIGYSINNTIVIFDRIRDALKKHHAQTKAAYKEIVNKSIAQTMSRSVNTSITTFVMVLVLYIMELYAKTNNKKYSVSLHCH